MDVWLNQAATWPSLIAAALALACVVVFGFGSPWYTSALGAAILGLFVGMVLPLGVVAMTRITALANGVPPATTGDGFGALRFVAYSGGAVAFLFVLIMVLVERRSGPVAQIPVGRHTGPTQTERMTR